jgi:LmbE family N-acetylglucosaminyl deacetylase/GT2 family glycosyltransferase
MFDILLNKPDYPSMRLAPVAGQRVLCLAPHPDDEILGCGGLLSQAATAGMQVHTVILTSGDQGLDPAQALQGNSRREESKHAAVILGLPSPEFFDWPDRQMRYTPPLIHQLQDLLEQHQPHWVLLPALSEPHPDHQVTCLAASEALLRAQISPNTVAIFYESGAPSNPNTLVDISAQAPNKWQALQAFVSQEQMHPYRAFSQAMATVRALGMGPTVLAAEAFFQITVAALRQSGISQAAPPLHDMRRSLHLANSPSQLPLVSVIIRSMDRVSLAQAVASVVAQTYPNIEVVVVNATGQPHSPLIYPRHRLAMRLCGPDGENTTTRAGQPLGRSDAANLGLDCAQGSLAMFLDDDDLLDAVHLENLVGALLPDSVASYSGVRVINAQSQWVRDYDQPWNPQRLAGINFLPIHAVLFRLPLVRQHVIRFDTALPVFEDWDFWCQLAAHGAFSRTAGCTATYRQHPGGSGLGDPQHPNHWEKWHRTVLNKHLQTLGAPRLIDALAWHALTLDQLELKQLTLVQQHGSLQQQHDSLQQQHDSLQQQHDSLQQQHDSLQQQHDSLQQEFSSLQAAHAVEQAKGLSMVAQISFLERSLALLERSRAVRLARKFRQLLAVFNPNA